MSVCCPPGSLGRAPLCERTPRGKLITWSTIVTDEAKGGSTNNDNGKNNPQKELSCYHVGPEDSPKRVIVVFTDVFGLEVGNHKAFCDVLQEKLGDDTAVYCPDLFRGNPLMHDYGPMFDWVTKLKAVWGLRTRCSAMNIDADLRDVVEPNVKALGCQMCGVVGFCFGGWVLTRCLGLENGRSIFAAGVGIHPSVSQVERVAAGGMTPIKLMERTQNKPILFLPAKEDDELKMSSPLIHKLAQRRALRVEDISIEFPTVSHGFVARGPFLKGEYKDAQDRAIQLTVDFMELHLKV